MCMESRPSNLFESCFQRSGVLTRSQKRKLAIDVDGGAPPSVAPPYKSVRLNSRRDGQVSDRTVQQADTINDGKPVEDQSASFISPRVGTSCLMSPK